MDEVRRLFVRLLQRLGLGPSVDEVDPDGFAAELLRLLRPCAHGRMRGLRACAWCDSYEDERRRRGWDKPPEDGSDDGFPFIVQRGRGRVVVA